MTTRPIEIAKSILFSPADLDQAHIDKLFRLLNTQKIDDADLYFQSTQYESWYLEDSEVKSGSASVEKGVGIRVVSGEKTGYAYCDDIEFAAMEKATLAARSIAQQGQLKPSPIWIPAAPIIRYPGINPLDSMDTQTKHRILYDIDKAARSMDPRVMQVNASLSGCYEVVMIAGLNHTLVADVRPLVSISVSVFVEDKGKRESARSGGGSRLNYTYFLEDDRALSFARNAVQEALVNLEAIDAPAGSMPVVLGPGWPAVLLHEAVGHGLEADFNRKGLSAFSHHLGEQVTAKGITIVDDGTLENKRGSLTIDDEGSPTQCTTLIEDGVLVNYMQDKLNARLMGMQPTGNCRRESYAHVPIPRMTNTYMQAGPHDPSEIIRSVKKGLYVANLSGGQVDITSGQFVFCTSEAYLIENGQVTRPVKSATLIGNGPAVMKTISMIGNDLALDTGVGVCGKEGQSIPVGVGQPTLKIDALTVGGTKK
jgi:TldD protein